MKLTKHQDISLVDGSSTDSNPGEIKVVPQSRVVQLASIFFMGAKIKG